jgi:broad specificity phosphatase PhoE
MPSATNSAATTVSFDRLPPIYLVRHGQTTWNREGRYQGQLNAPLTDQGMEQARAVGRRLRHEMDTMAALQFHCSPLGRCRDTMRLIIETAGWDDVPICYDDRLMEIGYGRWEGLTSSEITAREPEAMAARKNDPWNHTVPGGEGYKDVQTRIANWLEEQFSTTSPLFVVSHGASGSVLRGLYLNLTPAQTLALDRPQGSIIKLQDGDAQLLEGLPG